ncbi:MAG: ATP phosphoribosyltransferase [Anaerovoracaceae bacterium]
MDNWINVALPKGRLGNSVYDMLKRAGYECPEMEEDNRKLIFANEEKKIRYFQVKPSDVTIYVERGAADIGIAGRDIILENSPDVYELLDLEIGKCRMAEAAPKGWREDLGRTLRVATKFPNITRDYFNSESRDIDIIKLHGSIELAPIVGLSDVIVDIVETGTTLKENKLEVINTIVDISARLIANKASFQFKTQEIEAIRDALGKEVSGKK